MHVTHSALPGLETVIVQHMLPWCSRRAWNSDTAPVLFNLRDLPTVAIPSPFLLCLLSSLPPQHNSIVYGFTFRHLSLNSDSTAKH